MHCSGQFSINRVAPAALGKDFRTIQLLINKKQPNV